MKDKEIVEKVIRQQNKESRKVEYENKKSRAREMLRDKHISLEEYQQDLNVLAKDFSDLGEEEPIDYYSEMIEIVNLTQSLKEIILNGTVQAKRNILSKLGSNLVWDEKTLSISNKKSINTLVEGIKLAKRTYPEFEPKNYVVNKGGKEKTEPFSSVNSILLRMVNEVRTYTLTHHGLRTDDIGWPTSPILGQSSPQIGTCGEIEAESGKVTNNMRKPITIDTN